MEIIISKKYIYKNIIGAKKLLLYITNIADKKKKFDRTSLDKINILVKLEYEGLFIYLFIKLLIGTNMQFTGKFSGFWQ